MGSTKSPKAEPEIPVVEDSIFEDYPILAGVPSLVLKCGQISNRTKTVILIIPGNPGVADYYRDYMSQLYVSAKGKLPVWCLSHAGHGRLPSHAPRPDPAGDIYSLKGQILHKLLFIKAHIPRDIKLLLIGHSIGAYMILHMLEELDPDQVMKCYLLFPTIERMAMSPKGKLSTPLLKYLRWMARPAMFFPYYFVPHFVKRRVLEWYFQGHGQKKCAVGATLKIADPSSLGVILNMAHEEMQTVVKADQEIIKHHKAKLFWYYGTTDHWCPVEYYEDMKNANPEMDIILCKGGYDHAFVLDSSREMADLTWTWISKLITTQ